MVTETVTCRMRACTFEVVYSYRVAASWTYVGRLSTRSIRTRAELALPHGDNFFCSVSFWLRGRTYSLSSAETKEFIARKSFLLRILYMFRATSFLALCQGFSQITKDLAATFYLSSTHTSSALRVYLAWKMREAVPATLESVTCSRTWPSVLGSFESSKVLEYRALIVVVVVIMVAKHAHAVQQVEPSSKTTQLVDLVSTTSSDVIAFGLDCFQLVRTLKFSLLLETSSWQRRESDFS